MDYTELKSIMKERLPEKRFMHSVGVAETARSLAKRFSAGESDALIAGIYHDAYRYIEKEEALRIVKENSIEVFKEELENESLLHAPIAAFFMPRDAGCVSKECIKAVRCHSLGSKDMGILGAIIYIADYTEPGRKHLDDEERKKIFSLESLEKMVLYVIEKQKEYFNQIGIKSAAVTDELCSFLRSGGCFERLVEN